MAKKKKKQKQRAEPFDPVKDTGESRPVLSRIAVGDTQDKYSEYPSTGLTPWKLGRIFRNADEGDVRAQMELFEEMEEKDAHLFSQLQTRKLAVTGLDWEVHPASDAEQDKQVAEFISAQISGLENFDTAMMDMMDAVGKGISILEIEWDLCPVDGILRNVITDIQQVHAKKLIWDAITDEMKICTQEYPMGISLPDNKFVVHKYKAKSGHESRAGILRIIAWMYLFKNYTVKDWVAFCEVFGMPLRLGKYNQSASRDDKRELMEAIISLGSDAAGIVPDTTMIEFIESDKTSTADIYEKLARYCDEQMSKAILGQTLTSDSGGGSYAQSKTHNEVRHDLTVADAKALAATIRRDIITPLVEYNFGSGVGIPEIEFETAEAEDLKEKSEVYRTLVCEMGLKIPAAHVYKEFSIPVPETGDEVLSRVQAAPVPMVPEAYSLSLKEETGSLEQKELDEIVQLGMEKASRIVETLWEPIRELVGSHEGTLEELKARLQDKGQLQELYKKMDSEDLQDLLHQAMYLSELIGRAGE